MVHDESPGGHLGHGAACGDPLAALRHSLRETALTQIRGIPAGGIARREGGVCVAEGSISAQRAFNCTRMEVSIASIIRLSPSTFRRQAWFMWSVPPPFRAARNERCPPMQLPYMRRVRVFTSE